MVAARKRSISRRSRISSGFTLLELVLVMGIVSIVASVALPAIQAGRESARNAQCRNNLRQTGVAMQSLATLDPEGRYTTGTFDPERDGCPDTFGWMADMHRIKAGRPSEMRCPSSPHRGAGKLFTLLAKNHVRGEEAPEDRRSKGICGELEPVSEPAEEEEMKKRGHHLARLIRKHGMNTNYATSWFASRGQPRIRIHVEFGSHVLVLDPNIVSEKGLVDLRNTSGPLTTRRTDRGDVPLSNIPMLGDGSPARRSEHALPIDIRSEDDGLVDSSLKRGTKLAETLALGPGYAILEGALVAHPNAPAASDAYIPQQYPTIGTVITLVNEPAYASPTPGPSGTNALILQDTRSWSAVHGNSANVLMADGSVKTLNDRNNDGLFNPGFPQTPASLQTSEKSKKFKSGEVEINAFEVFVGTILNPTSSRRGGGFRHD